jgi:hypothetical protein
MLYKGEQDYYSAKFPSAQDQDVDTYFDNDDDDDNFFDLNDDQSSPDLKKPTKYKLAPSAATPQHHMRGKPREFMTAAHSTSSANHSAILDENVSLFLRHSLNGCSRCRKQFGTWLRKPKS